MPAASIPPDGFAGDPYDPWASNGSGCMTTLLIGLFRVTSSAGMAGIVVRGGNVKQGNRGNAPAVEVGASGGGMDRDSGASVQAWTVKNTTPR